MAFLFFVLQNFIQPKNVVNANQKYACMYFDANWWANSWPFDCYSSARWGRGLFFFITHSCTESDSFLISFTIWQFYCFCFDGNLFISINHIHIHILILSKVLNWQEIIGLWLTFTLNCMRFLFRISRGRAHRFGLHFYIPFWIKASICYCNGNNNSTMVLQ